MAKTELNPRTCPHKDKSLINRRAVSLGRNGQNKFWVYDCRCGTKNAVKKRRY